MFKELWNYTRANFRKWLLEEIWLEDYVKLGMQIGRNCSIQQGVLIDYSHCWLIKIGNNVTIAPQAYLLAHDASTKRLKSYTKISSITIEDNVFIGARALILPGVVIGANSIVAAGSIVTKSVPPDSVVAGNPAKIITSTKDYYEKTNRLLNEKKKYNSSFTIKQNFSFDKKHTMYQELIDDIGFVE